MRDTEHGMDNFGGGYMYRALMHFLRVKYPEILPHWEERVRYAVEWMEPSRMEEDL